MDKQSFINSIKDGALKGQVSFGVLPSLTIAQAILESGWGSSELAQKANNLFGIKAFSDWKGERITLETAEWYDGQRQVVNADFRAYHTFDESLEDHSKLLSSQRYEAVRGCLNYKEACERIYQCGYATDPAYVEKLIRIIEENKLYEFDSTQELKEVSITVEATKIRKFQHLCNILNIRDYDGRILLEDNILGPRTRSCIIKLPTLMEGSKGFAVEFVQEVVKAAPVDGDFGPITKRCVIEYQRQKGIAADGIVGQQTWTTIITS